MKKFPEIKNDIYFMDDKGTILEDDVLHEYVSNVWEKTNEPVTVKIASMRMDLGNLKCSLFTFIIYVQDGKCSWWKNNFFYFTNKGLHGMCTDFSILYTYSFSNIL